MSGDLISSDDAVQMVLENGWLTEEDIAEEISRWNKKAFEKLKKLLDVKGIEIRKLPKNPSMREESR